MIGNYFTRSEQFLVSPISGTRSHRCIVLSAMFNHEGHEVTLRTFFVKLQVRVGMVNRIRTCNAAGAICWPLQSALRFLPMFFLSFLGGRTLP